MNALIKVIITSIIGFISPLDTAGEQASVNRDSGPILEILYIDPETKIFCRFEELSCKKLNDNISS